MMKFSFILLAFFISHFGGSNGLDRSRLNANTANLNLLLSESGRGPNTNFANQKDFPSLPQSSTNNNGAQTGRVHDLVNFYNKQGIATNTAPKYPSVNADTPSFQSPNGNSQNVRTTRIKTTTPIFSGQKPPTSTIVEQEKSGIGINSPLSNQNGNGPVKTNSGSALLPEVSTPGKPSTKPTFSEILSGGNRGIINGNSNDNNAQGQNLQSPTNLTPKPSETTVASGGSSISTSPGRGPVGTPVLPSDILGSNNQPSSGRNLSDLELQTLSEQLLRKDTNNAAKLITVNYQEKTTPDSEVDKAPQPLFTIPEAVYDIPTIQKFIPLLDNYERDTLVNEYITPQERIEENAFMEAIMQTQVIRQLMTVFKDKGYVTPDPRQQRDFLKQLWFSLYSRGRGKISSSGFEHIFVSELKNGEVSGLHNWLYFAKEEATDRANYLGYLSYTQLGDKGAVLKHHFTQQGVSKPVDTMFVGTSPELEIALYSLCFVTRPDQACPLKLAGQNIKIVTHTFRYRSKNLIGSAYPQIA